jgi:transposase
MHAIAIAPNNATASSAVRVAVDLAKDIFELAFADASGPIVERKRLSRAAFARAFDTRPPLRIVMEACGSAHHWARRFQRLGHPVVLLPAHDVRPYVRRTKPTARMPAACWKPTAAAISGRCRSSRPTPKACRHCTASASSSRPSARR